MAIAVTSPAEARRHAKSHHRSDVSLAGPTDPSKDAALIIDGATGKVLYARNQDELRHPASLTKMMTLYLLFDALKKGQVGLNTTFPVSGHAAAQKPTNLHLSRGDSITVEQAIKAVVIRSANDVAVTIAEALGGTEGHFAEMMTAKARALGMRNTFYHNASGLPDDLQITTATDLGILARHLAYDFPQYYHYFATPAFNFRGVEYPTHDNLIGRYRGADGIKTGYTGASGFNLVSSVVRDNSHIIGVVMGGRTARKRDGEMINLLDNAFAAISHNPAMVARAQVPWQVASNTPNPYLAPAFSPLQGPLNENDDEDTAETRGDADDAATSVAARSPGMLALNAARGKPPVQAPAPPPRPQVAALPAAPRQVAVLPAPRQVAVPLPQPKPQLQQKPALAAVVTPQPRPVQAKPPVMVASLQPKPRPNLRPVILGEGDAGDNGTLHAALGLHDWTIQIGAFADLKLAQSQLAAYAEKSMDVLGQAQRIVVPFQSLDGHTLYRARFGPFLEREARQVCARLTERGQTCFAAIATR
jgi:D-alanyl-D-alanine carboxypeptidase